MMFLSLLVGPNVFFYLSLSLSSVCRPNFNFEINKKINKLRIPHPRKTWVKLWNFDIILAQVFALQVGSGINDIKGKVIPLLRRLE